MALNSGNNGSAVKTQVVKINHQDFQTDTSTDSQVVTVLANTTATDSRPIAILDATLLLTEAWVGGTITHTMGVTGDADAFVTALVNSVPAQTVADGINVRAQDVTVTTVGANTGTAGAGLSLIGDTSTVDQAANLMNDLVALQEDIVALEAQLGGKASKMPYAANIGASGVSVFVTVGTDTAWSSMTAGETLAIVTYIDYKDL